LKNLLSRTSRPNSIKLGTIYPWVKGIQVCTIYPWVKGIQVCSNKGSGPLQRGDKSQKCKKGVRSFKNLFLQNHLANFNQTSHKSSLGEGDLILLKERG
jgi:hypothetical protein